MKDALEIVFVAFKVNADFCRAMLRRALLCCGKSPVRPDRLQPNLRFPSFLSTGGPHIRVNDGAQYPTRQDDTIRHYLNYTALYPPIDIRPMPLVRGHVVFETSRCASRDPAMMESICAPMTWWSTR